MSRRGSVLILVVWAIASLSLLAAALGSRCLFALGLSHRLEGGLQARYIALAGIHRALQFLEEDPTPQMDGLNEVWQSSPETFGRCPFGAGWYSLSYPAADPSTGEAKLRYGFQDEQRKINLNTAPAEVLRGLLEQVEGLDEEEAQGIADCILDWRDEDHDTRLEGAEDFHYLGLELAYDCKDAPFENVEELLFIRGMSLELYEWMAPHVTVHGDGRVNLNTAGPEVLRALGLSKEGVIGLVSYRAGEDNVEGTTDDRLFASASAALGELQAYCPAEDLNRLSRWSSLLSAGSRDFEITVLAGLEEETEAQMKVHCVVERTGRIRSWSEG